MKKLIKGSGIAVEVIRNNPLQLLQKKMDLKEERRKFIEIFRESRHKIVELSLKINESDDSFDREMLELLKKQEKKNA